MGILSEIFGKKEKEEILSVQKAVRKKPEKRKIKKKTTKKKKTKRKKR